MNQKMTQLVLAAGFGLASMTAQAATLTAGAAVEIGNTDLDIDPILAELAASETSVTSGSIYSGYANDYDNSNYAWATAAANQDGWMYTTAGGDNTFKSVSHVQQSLTITNDTGVDQNYSFDFTILQGSLSAYGPWGDTLDAGEFVGAGNLVSISLDGVDLFSSAAWLLTNDTGTTLTTEGEVLGSFTGGEYYSWDGLSDTLDLGVFAAGESFTLTYDIYTAAAGVFTPEAGGYGDGYGDDGCYSEIAEVEGECGYYDGVSAYSQFGDPNGVQGSPIAGNVQHSPVSVPEPGLWLLMGTGLFGLAIARRRVGRG